MRAVGPALHNIDDAGIAADIHARGVDGDGNGVKLRGDGLGAAVGWVQANPRLVGTDVIAALLRAGLLQIEHPGGRVAFCRCER